MAYNSKKKFHINELNSLQLPDLVCGKVADNLDCPAISNMEFIARVLFVADRSRFKRTAWLQQVISTLDHRTVKEDIELCLTQADGNFDCVILHGSSLRRLKRPVRRIHELMPHKPIVCLLDYSAGNEVAELLSAGADDVFTLNMPPVEARARLRAVYRRHARAIDRTDCVSAAGAPVIDQRVIKMVEEDVPLKLLRRRERIVFRSLLANAERLMRYEEIVRLLDPPSGAAVAPDTVSFKALRVCMSRIRAVLPNYMHISNASGLGYALNFK